MCTRCASLRKATTNAFRAPCHSNVDADRYTYSDLIRLWAVISGKLDHTLKDAGTVKDLKGHRTVCMKLAANYVRWQDLR